ncbi:hypothetical protein FLONG3_5217 [Fusarium longipes]|uniref:NB-ARC domain-containing protein n=1 Tax=Fusarium longipes TaxID=694270 RepID=A0A395SWF4_9HYPO|nr:hypothetical protein FLONG3_5217 [Fusarium longipes]
MAEALAVIGLVANIAQFVEIGRAIIVRVSDFCSIADKVPAVYRDLLLQLTSLTDICEQYIKTSSRHSKALNQNEQALWIETLEHSKTIQELVGRVLPLPSDSKFVRSYKATKSVGLDRQLESYLGRLEAFKSSLILRLGFQTYMEILQGLPPSPKGPKRLLYLPPRSATKFIGRESSLELIDKILRPDGTEQNTCVLLGLGGQGKTSLALEYCQREVAKDRFSSIIWFDVASITAVQRRFAQIAEELCDYQRTFSKPEAAIHLVKSRIQDSAAPWLIVFDNYDKVDSISNILDYVPQAPNGAIIITSRNSDCSTLGPTLYLNGLDEDESIQLLLNRTRLEATDVNTREARAVVQSLGYLPLAIEQSAAFIRSRRLPLHDFVGIYVTRKEKIMSFNAPFLNYRRLLSDNSDKDGSANHEVLNVWTTWEMSFEQIGSSGDEPDAESLRCFLTTLAFFNKTEIRMRLFKCHWEICNHCPSWMTIFLSGTTWDNLAYQDCVLGLEKLSLIRYHNDFIQDSSSKGADERCISIHPLVKDWVQARLSASDRQRFFVQALEILSSNIAAGIQSTNWPIDVQQELLFHLDALISVEIELSLDLEKESSDDLEQSLDQIGRFLTSHGWSVQSEKVLNRLLAIQITRHGMNSSAIVQTQIALSRVKLLQGSFNQVESDMKRLLESEGGIFTHGDVLTCKRLLATSFFKQGRYNEAVSVFKLLLTEQLDPSYPSKGVPDALDTEEILAQVYRMMGQHSEARELHFLILSRLNSASNTYSPTRKWSCMVHLANSYRDEALRGKAVELYEQALVGFVASLGPDHPSTLTTRMFYAILESDFAMDDFDAPRQILQDVIERLTKVLGPTHVDTIKAISNLGILYHRAGQLDKAEALFQESLAVRERQFGNENPYTLRIIERLVGLFWAKGEVEKAEALALRGLGYQSSADSAVEECCSLSEVSDKVGQDYRSNGASEALFHRALLREESSLHEAHQVLIDMLECLATVTRVRGKSSKSLEQEISRRKAIQAERAK